MSKRRIDVVPMIFTEAEAREMIAHEAKMSGGQRRLAYELGLSAAFVNDVLKGRRKPTDRLLKAVGLVRKVVYTAP